MLHLTKEVMATTNCIRVDAPMCWQWVMNSNSTPHCSEWDPELKCKPHAAVLYPNCCYSLAPRPF